MEYKIIYAEPNSDLFALLRETESYNNMLRQQAYGKSFDIPEFGLRWPVGSGYLNLLSSQGGVLMVINEKQWLVTKIKYGL